MFPILSEELNFDDDDVRSELLICEKEKLQKIVDKTRKLDGFIFKMQKVGTDMKKVTCPSIFPAKALAKIVASFCFGKKLAESFNVLIKDQSAADIYGVPLNTALRIPVVIEKKKITPITDIKVFQFEKIKLREAQLEMDEQVKILINGNI